MAESQPTSHSDLMNLRAKGKKLHRRTQSHTTFSLNEVMNRKNQSEELFQEMLQNNGILNGDLTQKVLDAATREINEKEVIVDDIDEIPNTGIIVPQGLSNSLHNPLNNLQRRTLMLRNNFQANGSQFKKIDMLSQVRNIDDITGLGTIHEKRNSMESIGGESLDKRSPNMTNSGCSSQNVSKPVSRTHSKHPSLDFRVGHSNSSSMDFRPLQKMASDDMWTVHSKQSSGEFKPRHSKQSSADFRPVNKETFNHVIRVDKEIDMAKFSIITPKTVKVSDTIQLAANIDYFEKRNRMMNDIQKPSATAPEKTLKRGNSGTDHATSKVTKSEEAKPKPKATRTADSKEKVAKTAKPQMSAGVKHKRTYSGNISKGIEIGSPLAASAVFSNFKNPREYISYDTMPTPSSKFRPDLHLDGEMKKKSADDSVKKPNGKGDVNIKNMIETFTHEKIQLEETINAKDKKIEELLSLTKKYQEEIKLLKGKSEPRTNTDSEKKPPGSKEIGGLNILTSTDGSAFDSSMTESSGFLSNKDNRIKTTKANTMSLTPHGQPKLYTSKGDERKSPGIKPAMTKKVSLGVKKPATATTKKI